MKNNINTILFYGFLIFFLFVACGDSEQVKKENYNDLIVEIENSLGKEDYENVLVKADEALKIYGEYSQPNMYKAIAYYRQNKVSKSIKEAKKIIEKDGEKSIGAKILAQVYYHKKNDVEESLKYALQYNDSFPDDSENTYLLGTIFYEQNKYEEAIKFYSICINQDFYKQQSLVNRAKSFVELGNVTNGIEDYITLRQISDSSDFKAIDFRLADFYQKNKDYTLSNSAFIKIDSVLSYKYIAQNYNFMNELDSSLIYYNQYISHVSNDLEALESRYVLLKKLKINDEELFNYYKELKKTEKKEYNFWLKVCYIVIPFIAVFYILYRVNKYVFSKKYYDTYNVKTVLKYILLFPLGGAFNYTKNIYIVYFNMIVTSILLVYVFNLLIFNGYNEFFFKLILSENIFKILIISLLLVFIIDFFTIAFRIKYMNVKIRKMLNIKNVENRKQSHNQVINSIYDTNDRLNHIFRE